MKTLHLLLVPQHGDSIRLRAVKGALLAVALWAAITLLLTTIALLAN